MSAYTRSAELLQRLRLDFPIRVEVPDAMTGEVLTFERENFFRVFVIDAPNMGPDQQSASAYYVEMSRFQRACEKAAAMAEISYRTWKSSMMAECVARSTTKKPTVAEMEAYYRGHSKYSSMAGAPEYWKALAGLFADAKAAIKIKSEIMISMNRTVQGWDTTHASEAKQEEMGEERLEELEEKARAVIAASSAPRVTPSAHTPISPPSLDEDDDSEEEESEPEETDDDPPPPSPPKKTTKKAAAKKTTKKAKS